MLFTLTGLILNCFGLIVLFYFGLPNLKLYNPKATDETLKKGDATKIDRISKHGIILILLGLILQMIGTVFP